MPVPFPPDHLPDHLRDAARARLVADVVGFAAGVPAAHILTQLRGSRPIYAARQLVMYLMSGAFGMSLAHIAGAVGRDRSTVAHGMRRVEDRRDDPAFDAWVDALEETLRAAPQPPPGDVAATAAAVQP